MLLLVTAEYRTSHLVRILKINEENGSLEICHIDSKDANALQELQQELEEGLSFADFQIVKSQTEDGLDAFELRHFCTNVAPGEPDLSSKDLTIQDSPSFLGFLRKLITEGGSVVLPLTNVPDGDIPSWMTANANTLQFTKDMGIKVSHLIPGKEEDHWRWNSSVILMAGHDDKFGSRDSLMFLCGAEFEEGEYAPFLKEHSPRKVVQSDGTYSTYRVFSVTQELPVYPRKTNILVTPPVISRLKYVADSYKLALYSLTVGLFEDKKIEYSNSPRNPAPVTGRYVEFKNSVPISKKTADVMFDFLLKSMQRKTTAEDETEFIKQYPHYQVYSSILKSQTPTFFGSHSTKQQKMRAYRALKNVETYFNLLLQECRYHIIFDNNASLFNLWTSNLCFNSDIPNYKINISGGGGTWRPASFYL